MFEKKQLKLIILFIDINSWLLMEIKSELLIKKNFFNEKILVKYF